MSTASNDRAAVTALNRFGLGAKSGARERIASDPRGALEAEIAAADLRLDARTLQDSPALIAAFGERRLARLARAKRDLNPIQQMQVDWLKAKGRLASADADDNDDRFRPRRVYVAEAAALLTKGAEAGIGFTERLVHFWANHFAVSIKRGPFLVALAGSYEREAIRPHVLGRFADMLKASARHPAMLRYLDGAASIGPESRAGKRTGKGLNENHARELLELHTLGVDGGYAQRDVIALAQALTGYAFVARIDADDVGAFDFKPPRHEPGAKTVLGKRYAQEGAAQADAILDDLAASPATATHVARRLATAFVADEPPAALVDRLARTFRETGGDLREVSLALIRSDEAWDAEPRKMRSPQEFAFASVRALGGRPDIRSLARGLDALGQPLWGPPSPKGFPLTGRDWIAPDAQTNRLDLAEGLAAKAASETEPNALADDILGPALSDETRTAVKRAGSREQAVALLLMSPEMQRR